MEDITESYSPYTGEETHQTGNSNQVINFNSVQDTTGINLDLETLASKIREYNPMIMCSLFEMIITVHKNNQWETAIEVALKMGPHIKYIVMKYMITSGFLLQKVN